MKRATVFLLLSVALIALALVALLSGSVHLTLSELLHGLFSGSSTSQERDSISIIGQIRLPRVAGAILIGAALGLAGALMQGLFINPLADPAFIGISAGGVLLSLLGTAIGIGEFGSLPNIAIATLGAVIATRLIPTRLAPLPFILVGFGLGSLWSALSSLIAAMQGRTSAPGTSLWAMGSLSLMTWPSLLRLLPFLLAGGALAIYISSQVDRLALGTRMATFMGVRPGRVKWLGLIAAALLVGSSAALSGVMTFVGLVVPNVLRPLVGSRSRVLMPASALGGALLLLAADTLSRSLLSSGEVSLTLLLALIGSPVLVLILIRERASS
ncbi:MAG: iron ABC transporter permease [Actinomycetes bacterium]